jgi:hypothetical protein
MPVLWQEIGVGKSSAARNKPMQNPIDIAYPMVGAASASRVAENSDVGDAPDRRAP